MEFREIETRRSVTHDAENLLVGMCRLARKREREPGSQASEIAVRQESTRFGRRPRVRHPSGGLATVGDHDRVGVQGLRDLVRHPRRMNRTRPVFERLVEATARYIAHRAQPLEPFRVPIEFFVLRRFVSLAKKFAAIRNDPEFNIPVAPDLLGLDIDLDYACVARNYRVAPACKQPNPRTKQDYEVGAAAAFRMDRRMNRPEASEA